MTYGYIRVSTDKQDHLNQKHSILEYSNLKQLGKIEFIEETISSRKIYKDRNLSKLIEDMNKDDVLVVTEISRIGRSLLEVMSIFKEMMEKDIKVHIIKGGYIIGDDIASSVLIFAFGLSAEIERDLISSRTKQALAQRKAMGIKLGRKKGQKVRSKLDKDINKIKEHIERGVSVSSMAKIFGVARSTMIHFIKSRGL